MEGTREHSHGIWRIWHNNATRGIKKYRRSHSIFYYLTTLAWIGLVLPAYSQQRAGVPQAAEFTGETQLEFVGSIIPQSEIEPPTYVPLQRTPDSAAIYTNVRPAGEPQILAVPDQLPRTAPGTLSWQLPQSIIARPDTLSIEQPGMELALPPRINYTATYDLQYLDVDQGMLSSYTSYLLEDSKGYIWISSSVGLSRYDGNNFFHYTAENGLPKGTGGTMLEDSRGNLWLGMNYGVSNFDGQRFISYLKTEQGIRAIAEDAAGNLWFGGYDGLYYLNPREKPWKFKHYTTDEGLQDNRIHTLLIDRDDHLWIGTRNGLSHFDGKRFTHFTTEEGLSDNRVTSLGEDDQGRIWIGTEYGLNRYTRSVNGDLAGGSIAHFKTVHGLSNNNIKFLLLDSQQRVWIATNRGLSVYDGTEFTYFTPNEGLNTYNIRTILEDSSGKIWAGTGGGGVSRLSLKSFAHFYPHPRLLANGVMALTADHRGNVWMGTGKGAVYFNDRHYTYFTPKEGLIHLEVLAILEDSRNNIWFGTPIGASRYDGTGFTQYRAGEGLPEGEINVILEDSWSRIWFGTTNGLSCWIPGTNGGQFINFSEKGGLPGDHIKNLYEDRQKNLWICTNRGVIQCIPDSDQEDQVRYVYRSHLPGIDVRSILEDKRGRLWFGTVSTGLYSYDPTAEAPAHIRLTTRHGLSSNTIWSLQKDKSGNIWMGTEQGITMMQFSPDAPDIELDELTDKVSGLKFFTFYKEQGLRKLDFQTNSICLDGQNRIWWGSVGAAMLDLDQYEMTVEPPAQLALDRMDINQQLVDYRRLDRPEYRNTLSFGQLFGGQFFPTVRFANYPESIKLHHSLNHLTFYFSAIDWSTPQKIRYQYYLDGLEKSWSVPSRQASVDYRSLSSGAYTFKLRAGSEAGIWSEAFTYDFVIRPPWWRTAWAYLVYGLILLGIGYSIFSFFRKRLLLQNTLELRQQEADRLKEMDALKTRFFTNVSHELRTPLSLIVAPLKTLQQNGRLSATQLRLLNIARRNGTQLERLINQILNLQKLESGSLQLEEVPTPLATFLRRYVAQFESLAERQQIDFTYTVPTDDSLSIMLDQEKCRQIIYNLLANAFKFTPSGGRITAGFTLEGDHLRMLIADSGIGIHPDDLPRLFDRYFQTSRPEKPAEGGTGIGLALCQEYAHLFGGTIKVESEQGTGTTFQVAFPVRIASGIVAVPGEEGAGNVGELTAKSVNGLSGASEANLKVDPSFPAAAAGSKLKVLVVEDNLDLQDYIRLILSGKYQVDTVSNGREALDYIAGNPDCQLVLSDLMMPVMDGFQLLEKMRSDDATRHLPVIMLTARADTRDKLKALRIGVDDYLVKPFDEEVLLVRIENLMRNQSVRKQEMGAVDRPELQAPQLSKPDLEWLESFERFIAKELSSDLLSIPATANFFAMSESTLLRQVKRLTGLTPVQYLQEVRLNKARQLLEEQSCNSVAQLAAKVGYENTRSFSRAFKKRFGQSPSELL